MSERKAAAKQLARSYPAGDRAGKGRILDDLVELRASDAALLRHSQTPDLQAYAFILGQIDFPDNSSTG